MREFFYGWRRKSGCALLVMAFVFTGGWLRSSFIKHHLTYVPKLASSIQAISFDGHFGFWSGRGFPSLPDQAYD